jgi:hypothetical protein
MLARPLLIGVMALATLPGVQTSPPTLKAQSTDLPTRTLLSVRPLSDEIRDLSVNETSQYIEVEMRGRSWRDGEKEPRPLWLSGTTIQVWLLRSDGKVVAQREKPVSVVVGNAGSSQGIMQAHFDPVPPQELAGVVVSVDGKLYVREIKVNPAS